jgi:hypothetical protein
MTDDDGKEIQRRRAKTGGKYDVELRNDSPNGDQISGSGASQILDLDNEELFFVTELLVFLVIVERL